MKWLCLVATALWLAILSPAIALGPDEVLSDAALEARARALSKELRCMVCQNQSIDDSDAPLAYPCARTIAGGRERPAGDQFSGRALRRVRAAEAAIFVAYRAAVACSGDGAAYRSMRRPRARTPLSSGFRARNRGAPKAHGDRSGAAVGDFAPGRTMRRDQFRTS